MARPRFQHLDRATREKILETAATRFAAKGFDGTSLNGLIEDLGISKGSFYYYFDDKADLFITVADRATSLVGPATSSRSRPSRAAVFCRAGGELQKTRHHGAARIPWVSHLTSSPS